MSYEIGGLEDALSDINLAIRAVGNATSPAVQYLASDIHVAMRNYTLALRVYQQGLQIAVSCEKDRRAKTLGVNCSRPLTEEENENVGMLQRLAANNDVAPPERFDPVVYLPADIIEIVMQQGIDNDDEYFALRCGWVSQAWRSTTQSMSSLWRTYKYNPSALRTLQEKREAWTRLAGDQPKEVRLRTEYGMLTDQIAAELRHSLQTAKKVVLQGTALVEKGNIQRLAEAISASRFVTAIFVQPSEFLWRHNRTMDLELSTDTSRPRLEEICIAKVTFAYRSSSQPEAAQEEQIGYAALRKLVIKRCYFDAGTETLNAATGNSRDRYIQADPLHALLRTSPNLEVLQIDCRLSPGRGFPTSYERPLIEMKQIHSLRIPPPSRWTIDIKAPGVRHLAFSQVERPTDLLHYELPRPVQSGLLPNLATFAVTEIDVDKLVTLELAINGSDSWEALYDWLRQARGAERLVVRSSGHQYRLSQLTRYYSKADSVFENVPEGKDPANTANRTLVTTLAQNPGLCPILKILELVDMYVPEKPLLEWIQARTQDDHAVSPIASLSLIQCTHINMATDLKLRQEVPTFTRIEYEDISRHNWQELCNDWDEDVMRTSSRLRST